ncbi:MAG: hypothetical protein ACK5OA_06535 [Acidovorax sp.]|jgi:hypothetical protein
MERWEIIERYTLLAVGMVLLLLDAWLLFSSGGHTKAVALVFLVPFTFWVFWQSLYEDNLDTSDPPTRGERVMFSLWVWARRLVLGSASALFAFGTWHALRGQELLVAGSSAVFAVMAGWVAIYGGGKSRSMSDDRRVHRQRMKRYK